LRATFGLSQLPNSCRPQPRQIRPTCRNRAPRSGDPARPETQIQDSMYQIADRHATQNPKRIHRRATTFGSFGFWALNLFRVSDFGFAFPLRRGRYSCLPPSFVVRGPGHGRKREPEEPQEKRSRKKTFRASSSTLPVLARRVSCFPPDRLEEHARERSILTIDIPIPPNRAGIGRE